MKSDTAGKLCFREKFIIYGLIIELKMKLYTADKFGVCETFNLLLFHTYLSAISLAHKNHNLDMQLGWRTLSFVNETTFQTTWRTTPQPVLITQDGDYIYITKTETDQTCGVSYF